MKFVSISIVVILFENSSVFFKQYFLKFVSNFVGKIDINFDAKSNGIFIIRRRGAKGGEREIEKGGRK